MNEKNLENLEKSLLLKGFGDKLNAELKEKIKTGADSFKIDTTMDHGGKKVDYSLSFSKGKENENYFFNNYTASIKAEHFPKEANTVSQTFFFDQGRGVTAKEAFNLLEGRSALKNMETKDGEKYRSWVAVDLNKLNEKNNHPLVYNGEFLKGTNELRLDLNTILTTKYKIKEAEDPKTRQYIIESLERGNVHAVTMVRDEKKIGDGIGAAGEARKTFISADPQYRTLNVFDENMKRVYQENKKPSVENGITQPSNPEVNNPIKHKEAQSFGASQFNAQLANRDNNPVVKKEGVKL